MSRASQREFVLLLPPHLTVSSRYGATLADGHIGQSKRELKTASLELLLAQLGLALKRNAKTQRPLRQGTANTGPAEEARSEPVGIPERRRKNRDSGPRVAFDVSHQHSDPAAPKMNGEPRRDKGKLKEVPRQFFLKDNKTTAASIEKDAQQSCWWLDVASPTWDDMKALGKVRPLLLFYEERISSHLSLTASTLAPPHVGRHSPEGIA
jgi:magnesium transporter